MEVQTFFDVEADPTLSVVEKGAAQMASYQPDVILALGGGSPMDAAKIMWVTTRNPATPRTLRCGSTTACSSSARPIRVVPTG